MSTTFNRIQIGQVDVNPGDVRMLSDESASEVTSPGFLNRVAVSQGFPIYPTDVITAVYGSPQISTIFKASFIGQLITLVPIAGGSGEANTASNIGAGDGIFDSKIGVDLQFKSLSAGSNVTLTPTSDSIIIGAVIPDVGEANTSSNLGIGAGLAAPKVGVDLPFKSLIGGSGIALSTDASSVTITATGAGLVTNGENLGTGQPVFLDKTGTLLRFNTLIPGTNVTITQSNDESGPNGLIINATGGGGGGNFNYQNTYWLAKNGNDANSGTSINEPKLTLSAIAAALLPSVPTVLNIVDDGIYPMSASFSVKCPLLINAPGATINWTGADSIVMFSLNTFSPLIINVGAIINNGANIFAGFSSIICTCPFIDMGTILNRRVWNDSFSLPGDGAPQAIFNIGFNPGALASFVFKYNGEQIINATNLGLGQISSQLTSGTGNGSVQVNADYYNGVISGTADYNLNINYLGAGFNYTGSGQLDLNVSKSDVDSTTLGAYNGIVTYNANPAIGLYKTNNVFNNPISMNNNPIYNEVYSTIYTSPTSGIWSFLPGYQNGNQQVVINNTNGTLILPLGSSVPSGWRMTAIQTVRNSGATVQVQAPDTFNGQFNTGNHCYTGAGKAEFIRGPANGGGGYVWIAAGNVFQVNTLSTTITNVFISQISGDDAIADGSINNEFATINAALAYVIANYTATPTHGINLVITDDATYNEKLNFTGTSNIHLVGRTAIIRYISGGLGDDAFTSNASSQLISVGALEVSGGGRCINNTGTGTLIFNVDALGGGDIDNTLNGSIFIQSYIIQGAIPNTGIGAVQYTTLERFGVDGTNVLGTNTEGASRNWVVKGQLSGNNIQSTTDIQAGTFIAANSSVISGQPGSPGALTANPNGAGAGAISVRAADNTANVITVLQNQPTSTGTIHFLPNVNIGNVSILPCALAQVDPMSNLIYFDTLVTAVQLAGGASVNLITTPFGGQYRIRELFINAGGINFTGGDRILTITDGAAVYSEIPSANLLTITNNRWGSVALPFPASGLAINALTIPGANLSAKYLGGTLDYLTGAIIISGCWEKVV